MSDLLQELLEAFRVEHKDHLEVVRRLLDKLEQTGWDIATVDMVELHRRIHSLKGAARAVDARSIETTSHLLESIIERCQKGLLVLDEQIVLTLKAALDAVEDTASVLKAGVPAGQLPAQIVEALERVLQQEVAVAPAPRAQSERPNQAKLHAPAGGPEQAVGREDPLDVASTTPSAQSMRIDARSLDSLFECSGELLSVAVGQEALDNDLRVIEGNVRAVVRAVESLWTRQADTYGEDSRDEIHVLERGLHDVVQGLRSFARDFRTRSGSLRRLSGRFDRQVRQVRLVPAELVFGGAGKVVRDLARDYGKSIRVDVRGLDTRVDRPVLQALKDPVMHVLRNAVGHGIEGPVERTAVGKQPDGRLVFVIASRGGKLTLRIEDDGRGVDSAKVKALAVERGALAGGDAELDRRTLTGLLATPGFSTAATVTNLSGRGMGLSVVAEAVARLQGDFLVRARDGGGTVVEITVPVAATSKRLIFLRCRDELYCVAAHSVARIHRIPYATLQSVEGRPTARDHKGDLLPLVPLSVLFEAEADAAVVESDILSVVEFRSSGTRIGVVVDAVVTVRDDVVRDLGVSLGSELVSGGVVTEDGSVVAALDPSTVVERCLSRSGTFTFRTTKVADARIAPTVLVVDDSITTRTLEKSILEANGFEVHISVDGADALERIRRQRVDLVISDIEMPRMDGFDLVKALKSDDALKTIPIILVTSRNKDADRRRGLSLGADAYVVKQRFDQTELLETIGQLL